MTITQKIDVAKRELADACSMLCERPSDSSVWREVCRAKATLVALRNCAVR
jgi:hypothetical protein